MAHIGAQTGSPDWLAKKIQNLADVFISTLIGIFSAIFTTTRQRKSISALFLLLSGLLIMVIAHHFDKELYSERGLPGLQMVHRFFAKGEMVCGAIFVLAGLAGSISQNLVASSSTRIFAYTLILALFFSKYAVSLEMFVYLSLYIAITIGLLVLNIFSSRGYAESTRLWLLVISCAASYLALELARMITTALFPGATIAIWNLPFSSVHVLCFASAYIVHDLAHLEPRLNPWTSLSHALSPVKLVAEMPLFVSTLPEINSGSGKGSIPGGQLRSAENRVTSSRARAIVSLFQSAFCLMIANYYYDHFVATRSGYFLIRGFHQYLFYYFLWLGVTRCSFAAALALGYQLEPVTDYALLASDPLARWKKWNLYYYDWFLISLFLPVSRWSRSLSLGVVVVFVVNLLIHNVGLFTLLIFHPANFSNGAHLSLMSEFWFYVMQGLSVYLGFRLRKFWPKSDRLNGWVGVFITTLMMAATHAVLRLSRT